MPRDASSRWRIEPLTRHHDRVRFACGEPPLDEYLVRFARQHQESGVSRTFVAVSESEPTRVVGFYSLTVGAIERSNLPPAAAKRFPAFPLPIARLARLAVDQSQQGKGLGEYLLMDALFRCWHVTAEVGIIAVLVDAEHERAKAFYSRYDFVSLPDQPLTLWLPVTALSRLFEPASRERR